MECASKNEVKAISAGQKLCDLMSSERDRDDDWLEVAFSRECDVARMQSTDRGLEWLPKPLLAIDIDIAMVIEGFVEEWEQLFLTRSASAGRDQAAAGLILTTGNRAGLTGNELITCIKFRLCEWIWIFICAVAHNIKCEKKSKTKNSQDQVTRIE